MIESYLLLAVSETGVKIIFFTVSKPSG